MPMEGLEEATYTLLLKLEADKRIKVGSLGNIKFQKGLYSYTGSAFGPGGVKRIQNHLKISKGRKDRKKWHIDYLTSDKDSSIEKVFLTAEKKECEIAEAIDAEEVRGFGSSDCSCTSHLKFRESRKLSKDVEEAFRQKEEVLEVLIPNSY